MEPAFRATWAKFTVGSIKRMPSPERERLLASIGDDLRREVREAPSLGWQPARVFSALCERIARCGRETALRFWADSLRASIDRPLIGTLAQGGLALLGRSPAALYARTPRAWSLVSRACGQMRYEPGDSPDQGSLHVRDLPPICRKHPGLLLLWEGGFMGQARYVGHSVQVQVQSVGFAERGAATFRMRWTS